MTIARPLHRRSAPPPAPAKRPLLAVVPAPSPLAASELPTLLLMVDFTTSGGRQWSAIGGGESVAEAVEVARQSLPANAEWRLVGWNELYGE